MRLFVIVDTRTGEPYCYIEAKTAEIAENRSQRVRHIVPRIPELQRVTAVRLEFGEPTSGPRFHEGYFAVLDASENAERGEEPDTRRVRPQAA